ncbi:DUF427 domain-containing protein [Hoyosella rhizosphaerae]|uniref:DUF427 domain-containing protein n=1 Tax=Hoyosella rhizosphaerae TaxID=1755582 RepID=A0A916U2M9_9ACTN|nr:DUF427 domain-containing protein [Hoyosella rhizosphaerae]MBN4926706.1 DUF427 domain-containing protein [Hoyosella rhizosphaerae]GGC57060.1 hypothetical protein GCM10011410_07000 [Hoyosella rhizosphaerae]
MIRAVWNDTVIAEAESTVKVEGNHYFPPESVKRELLRDSTHTTVCHWKGTAHYYDIVVDGSTGTNLGWYYPTPHSAAANIKDHVAFYPQVRIEQD